MAVSVQAVRVGIAVALGYGGTRFLTFTVSLEALLLNVLALEWILNVDDTIFENFAPSAVFLSRYLGACRRRPPNDLWRSEGSCLTALLVEIFSRIPS